MKLIVALLQFKHAISKFDSEVFNHAFVVLEHIVLLHHEISHILSFGNIECGLILQPRQFEQRKDLRVLYFLILLAFQT